MGRLPELAGQIKPVAVVQPSSNEEELGELEEPYPLIPEGQYDIAFIKKHKMPMCNNWRLITYWRIMDLGPYLVSS